MYFIVSIYGETNQQFATAHIEALDLQEANVRAIQFMKEQNPDIDISFYNQTLAIRTYATHL